ncbi:hypothetical protein IFM89_034759 [Coptis chinensis]|uniref:Uncharacterized protein n=1 Tax=Coptis chinensis TaxID=261450 RepID=A0A835LPG6_9MAGN|nr:hypothetical protein IFM89_034759 [Coptis chinensis]
MCFMMDPFLGKKIYYVQFPQRFDGIDRNGRYSNRNIVFFDVRCMLSLGSLCKAVRTLKKIESEVFLGQDSVCDVEGNELPRLVYVSREKKPGFDHHKKAGAMHALVYVGGIPHDASEKDPKGFCESVGEVTEDDERQRLARE